MFFSQYLSWIGIELLHYGLAVRVTVSQSVFIKRKEFKVNFIKLSQYDVFQSMYNSLGAAIVDHGRLDFDNYVKKACPMMLVDDNPEKKATTSNRFMKFTMFY